MPLPALLALLGAVLSDEQRTNTLETYPGLPQLALQAPSWPDVYFEPGARFDPQKPFRLGNVYFSTEAPGTVGYTTHINYMGFVIWMTPREFLRLNPQRVRPHDYVLAARAEGLPMGPLMLSIDMLPDLNWDVIHERQETSKRDEVVEPLEWIVTDHEGRGRAIAQNLIDPERLVPVLVMPRYMRAQHLTPDMLLGGFIVPDRLGGTEGHFIRRITINRVNHGWAP